MRLLVLIFLSVLLAYGGLCAVMFVFQRTLIYLPQPRTDNGPGTTVTLAHSGENIVVSVRPHAGPKAVIYLGGNAEDVAGSLPLFSRSFPDQAIFMLHYRGYGGSSGKATEQALHADAEALFNQVQRHHPEITVVGRSLGSGVAIRLAARRPLQRLVLITPYNSLQEIAAAQYPWIPVRWLLSDTFESWRHAPAVTVPTLVLLAERDQLIPHASTERLLGHFKAGIARRVIIEDSDHNSILDKVDYQRLLGAP